MKILFVTLKALEVNSSVTISNIGLLNGLVELGHDVALLMPLVSKNLNYYDSSKGIDNRINIIRIEGNTVYERMVIGKSNRFKGMLVKILRKVYYKVSLHDNSLSLVNRANINLLKNKKYDLVISTSDPKTSHMFVDKLIQRGLKYNIWVQHWGDPLSLDITKKSIYPSFYIRCKERRIFSCADRLIYVSPLTEIAQRKIFPKYADKMRFLPLPYYKEKIYKKTRNEKITIGYFGDYNSKVRDISPLYNFCKRNPKYNLIIAGSTDQPLEEKENIKIFPRIKQEEVDKLEEKCDILVSICNKKGTQIPGKIYYYAATNKPILVILDGIHKEEIGNYLSKYKRFSLCENNSKSLGIEIEQLLQSNQEYAPAKEFSAIEIARKLIEFTEQNI